MRYSPDRPRQDLLGMSLDRQYTVDLVFVLLLRRWPLILIVSLLLGLVRGTNLRVCFERLRWRRFRFHLDC